MEMIKKQRYFVRKHCFRNDEIHDNICNHFLNTKETVELLNELENDKKMLKDLKVEYRRINNILNDFLEITNRLQADPNNSTSLMMARDMLLMMGVELIDGDVDE